MPLYPEFLRQLEEEIKPTHVRFSYDLVLPFNLTVHKILQLPVDAYRPIENDMFRSESGWQIKTTLPKVKPFTKRRIVGWGFVKEQLHKTTVMSYKEEVWGMQYRNTTWDITLNFGLN